MFALVSDAVQQTAFKLMTDHKLTTNEYIKTRIETKIDFA